MTKRKAIEAAIERARAQVDDSTRKLSISALSAEYAYALGRIAGLREAANLRSVNGRSAGGPIGVCRDAIKDHANVLAKKVRMQ